MYAEASERELSDASRMLSPKFNMTGPACLSFWYHLYGESVGRLRVFLYKYVCQSITIFVPSPLIITQTRRTAHVSMANFE